MILTILIMVLTIFGEGAASATDPKECLKLSDGSDVQSAECDCFLPDQNNLLKRC